MQVRLTVYDVPVSRRSHGGSRRAGRGRLRRLRIMSLRLRAVALGLCLTALATACQSSGINEVRNPVAFNTPLAIPTLNQGTLDGAGNRVVELMADESSSEFLPGKATATWGYNGSYLGPTLRAER